MPRPRIVDDHLSITASGDPDQLTLSLRGSTADAGPNGTIGTNDPSLGLLPFRLIRRRRDVRFGRSLLHHYIFFGLGLLGGSRCRFDL